MKYEQSKIYENISKYNCQKGTSATNDIFVNPYLSY